MKLAGMAHRDKKATTYAFIFMISLLLFLSSSRLLQASTANQEYRVKAALIYKLTKFISWPPDALNLHPHFGICILGKDSFGTVINELESRSTKGKPIKVLRFLQSQEISSECQVLFIEQSKEKFLPSILTTLSPLPILTVSDFDGFAQKKGMLEFQNRSGKTEFIVNLSSLKSANLQASAPLLGLARTINNDEKH